MSYLELKNGEKIYFEDTGEGAHTIVMLHGWTSTHDVFEPVVSVLEDKARCITYDHRGHGKSKDTVIKEVTIDDLASDLNELVQSLGLNDFTLLGWSMGAAVTLRYTEMFGCDALRQVVLCDITPKQLNDDEWHLGLYKGAYTLQDMERDKGKSFYKLYKEFAIGAMPKLAKVPGFLLRKPLKEKLSECDEEVVRSLSKSLKAIDLRGSVGKITVPVHYFYAVPGSLYSPELADWYKDNVTSSYEAVPIENSTHLLITDNPEKFTQEVMRVVGES